jgi:hypothetical protein
VAVDFFFNCWCLEIPSENHIGHEPRCVYNHARRVRLGTSQDSYAGSEYSARVVFGTLRLVLLLLCI